MRKVSTVPFQALVSPFSRMIAVEVLPELAHQQVVGVEPALVEIEDVVAMRVEQVARLLDDVLVDHRRIRAVVVGDAVEQRLQIVGAALEHRLPGGQPLVVGHQLVAAGAVLLRRGGGRPDRHAGLPDPDVGLLVQEAARLLEVAVGLARAAGAAELVHQLGREAAQRRHDAALDSSACCRGCRPG